MNKKSTFSVPSQRVAVGGKQHVKKREWTYEGGRKRKQVATDGYCPVKNRTHTRAIENHF